MTNLLNLLTPAMIVGVLLYIGHVLIVLIFLSRKHKDIWGAIIGRDKVFDIEDLMKLLWIFLFLTLVFSDLYFDFTVGEEIWWSMNAILSILILKDLGQEYFSVQKLKHNDNGKEN